MCGIGAVIDTRTNIRQEVTVSRKHGHRDTNDSILSLRAGLRRRGPDKSTKKHLLDGRLVLLGSVLFLRGTELCPQPLHDSATGNALLWNGEVFAGLPEVGPAENDTVKVMEALCHADINSGEDVANVLVNVKGPYAFIFYHAAQGVLFFGRDPLGRRSLLLQHKEELDHVVIVSVASDSHALTKEEEKLEGLSESKSLLPTAKKPKVDEVEDDQMPTEEWTELPVSGIFSVNCNGKPAVVHHPWPSNVVGLVSFRVSENTGCCSDLKEAEAETEAPPADLFLECLRHSVHRRVSTIPRPDFMPKDHHGTESDQMPARVGVLFSGGIDSVVIAALCHESAPQDEPIDLINVCFEDGSQQSPDRLASIAALQELRALFPSRLWRLICVDVPYSEVMEHQSHITTLMQPCNTHMDFNIGAAFWFASRAKGYLYLEEEIHSVQDYTNCEGRPMLRFASDHKQQLSTDRQSIQSPADVSGNACPVSSCRKKTKKGCYFKVCRNCCLKIQNQLDSETLSLKHRHPSLTVWLENNAGWVQPYLRNCFERGLLLCPVHKLKNPKDQQQAQSTQKISAQLREVAAQPMSNPEGKTANESKMSYQSNVKVLLVGIGADEQLGGYGRHRSAYIKGGEQALRQELAKDMERLWTRNLGRDDRCISDHGREARFPFLDEDVVSYVRSLHITQVADLSLPVGIGDKKILRDAAKTIGLQGSSELVKRAIQFGSRIAKHSNIQSFGSNRKGRGESRFQQLRTCTGK